MQFDKGQRVGEMHGHAPSESGSPLVVGGYRTAAVIEIEESQASAIGNNLGFVIEVVRRYGKQAFVVAANDDQVVVLYCYDGPFFLTTLVA